MSSLWGREASRRTNTEGEPWMRLLPADTDRRAYYVRDAAAGPLHVVSHLILAIALRGSLSPFYTLGN